MPTPDRFSRSVPWTIARVSGIVFVAAFAMRALHLLAVQSLVFYRAPFGDAKTYIDWAGEVATTGPLAGPEPYFQGPLLPLALGAATALGVGPGGWLWIQTAIGALTAAGVARLAGERFGAGAALFAGACWAAYDMAIFFDADHLAASLSTALLVWGLVALDRTRTSPRLSVAAAAGGALGLAAWGRPNLLLPAVAVAAAAVLAVRGVDGRARGSRIASIRALLLTLSIAAALPVLRNAVVAGEPVFTTGGGVNAYIGSHRGAPGTFVIPPSSGLANDVELDAMSRRVASQALGRPASGSDASRWWLSKTFDEIVEAPLEAVGTATNKLRWLVSRVDVSNHLDIERLREASPVLRSTPVRSWVLLVLGALGLVIATRPLTMPVVFGAGVVVSLLPFFVTARYRLSLMPIFAVAAGAVVAPHVWRSIGARRRILAGVVGAAVWLLAWWPMGSGRHAAGALVNEGALHLSLGETALAEAAFRRALEIDPDDPRAQLNLAMVDIEAGRLPAALTRARAAVEREPGNPRAWNTLGIVLGESEAFDESLAAFERAMSLSPAWAEPRENLAVTWARYRAVCQQRVAAAGLAPPTTGESARTVVEYLRESGFVRAAEDLRSRIADAP